MSRSAACGYWQRKRALDGGLGPSEAHGRGIGAVEMGMSHGFGADGEILGGLKEKLLWAGWDRPRRNGMGVVVAMGAVALGKVLPVEDLFVVEKSACVGGNRSDLSTLTIQATGMAQPGMFSLQKPRTSVRAVISKGINSAS
jgi:hypothetical protein